MPYTMHTQFTVHVSDQLGDDGHDVNATITYSVDLGYPDSFEEPGCGPTVSISAIYIDGGYAPAWLIAIAEQDNGLTEELLKHASDCEEYRRDQAADARREERLLGDVA